jgi:hypothetical protein
MTLAPSSAAAERVFSILKNSFSVGQMWLWPGTGEVGTTHGKERQ